MRFSIPTAKTKVLIQGITHSSAAIHMEKALVHDTEIVGGVSHEKGLKEFLSVPVFQTVRTAVRKTKPDMCVVFSSPVRVYEDVAEVAAAKVPLIIVTTERVPIQEALRIRQLGEKYRVSILGPASPGILVPNACVAGTMPAHLFKTGVVGIVARSSSPSYEAVQQLSAVGLGVSACVALGTSSILGCGFVRPVKALLNDPNTKAILIIGEVEGSFEMRLAEFYGRQKRKKPLFVYIAGKTLPRPAIVEMLGTHFSNPADWIRWKHQALRKAGAQIIREPDLVGTVVSDYFAGEKK